jgi:hypothetical protein
LNLVLVATPLQVLIVESVLRAEGVRDYDLVYSARSHLASHRHYFDKLAPGARHAAYVADTHVPSAPLRHLVRRVRLHAPYFSDRYSGIYVSSIDSMLFRSLVGRHPEARVVTFDDGAANVFTGSKLHAAPTASERRAATVLRHPTIDQVRARIDVHYSIYDAHDNIVEPARVRHVPLWSQAAGRTATNGATSFFLGQPYAEAVQAGTLGPHEIDRLRTWLRANPMDYYLLHPRETTPLAPQDNARRSPDVAEEQVFALAGATRPRLFGWFTSVLLNVPATQADKVYLSVGEGPAEAERIRLMQRAGCEIHHV